MMNYPPGVVLLTTEALRGKLPSISSTYEEEETLIAHYSENKSYLITLRTIIEYLLHKRWVQAART